MYYKDYFNLQDLVSGVFKIIRHVQLRSHPLLQSTLNPYSDDNVRVELYKLLHSMCVNDIPGKNSWIVKSVGIFKLALRDPSIEVSFIFVYSSFSF